MISFRNIKSSSPLINNIVLTILYIYILFIGAGLFHLLKYPYREIAAFSIICAVSTGLFFTWTKYGD